LLHHIHFTAYLPSLHPHLHFYLILSAFTLSIHPRFLSFAKHPITMHLLPLLATGALVPLAQAHIAFFHTSMWGLDVVSANNASYPDTPDNRPIAPMVNYTFDQWWFHGHLNNPPAPGQFFELPAGEAATAELACAKSLTSFAGNGTSWGGTVDNSAGELCPGKPGESFQDKIAAYHTTGVDDLGGCALAITYESDVSKVQPEVRVLRRPPESGADARARTLPCSV
jgi:hypothetical protein